MDEITCECGNVPLKLSFIIIHLGLKFGQEWIGINVT
jgi:hypothetical protein